VLLLEFKKHRIICNCQGGLDCMPFLDLFVFAIHLNNFICKLKYYIDAIFICLSQNYKVDNLWEFDEVMRHDVKLMSWTSNSMVLDW